MSLDGDCAGMSLDETISAVEGRGQELNAVTSVMADRARNLGRKSAERAAAGAPARALEGVPFAIKDVIDVAGFPTTMGSNVSTGPDPSATAPVVSLLEKAGALPVAKTNCQEFSYGILGDESAFGRVVNPLDPALCTGGSSSGAAALVAAGVVPLALGTDTAGSVRVPAACQGIIGFKPTFGVVPTGGVFPLSPSFDTVGLFARDIGVLTSAFDVIAGNRADGSVADGSVPPRELAASVTVDLSLLCSSGISGTSERSGDDSANAARRWAEAHLANVTATSARSTELGEIIDRLFGIYDIVRRYEATLLHRRFAEEQGELYQPGVWAKIMSGQTITEEVYREQVRALDELRASTLGIFDDVDFIVTPAIEGEVIRWDQIGPDSSPRFIRYAMPFNVLGWPAVTVPIGAAAGTASEDETGADRCARPQSVQIIGRPHDDRRLLEFVAEL